MWHGRTGWRIILERVKLDIARIYSVGSERHTEIRCNWKEKYKWQELSIARSSIKKKQHDGVLECLRKGHEGLS